MSTQRTILVTNGCRLTASRCILSALQRNFSVITTVRSPRRINELHGILSNGGASQQQISSITFIPYNELFTLEDCYHVVAGCDYIIHAIPYSSWDIRYMGHDDSVSLAKDSVLHLLQAAQSSNPRCRVVIFNSFWAVNGNVPLAGKGQPYTEADWSTVHPLDDISTNILTRRRNLTVTAERAIWEWHASRDEGKEFHVSVIDPVSGVGPILHSSQTDSQSLIQGILSGKLKEGPDHPIGAIDPRDLADLAFLCLDNPASAGERYIACPDGDMATIKDITRILKTHMQDGDAKGTVEYSAWKAWELMVLKFTGVIDADLKRDLPKGNKASSEKAKGLGWRPRGSEECIVAALEALREFGGLRGEKG